MSGTATSFKLANDQPFIFKNYQQAANQATKRLKLNSEEDEDADEILRDIVAVKRKKYEELQPRKKLKNHSTPLLESPTTAPRKGTGQSTPIEGSSSVEDDIDWSDDGEFFRNVSLLETSKSSSNTPSKGSRLESEAEHRRTGSSVLEADSGAILLSDDEEAWSDCDRELNDSIAKLGRSALQEVTNTSDSDQQLSDSRYL